MVRQKIERWSVLEQEDISPSPWFPLTRETVKLPGGQILNDYYFAPLGDVVQVLALTPQHEVILVKQYKHGLGDILLELPGGMQQPGKGLIDSAIAEMEEETGVKTTADKLISLGRIAINPTKLKQVTYGYLLFDAEFNSTQKPDPSEVIELITLPAPQVLQMVKDGEIWTTDSVCFILKASIMYPHIFAL
ncbi:NUDIX hydrolase [Mucilaginibacter sp. PPCGB 2223]|uniref:NUDIX hydrolase n=1 Tax=Mucilaginibacter sp. PPCGB 2223 TaxID=1886027 RepID=UPI0008242D03|nr:NUDIX hydrolase [Mucilaginibacter sp. PPCGB 2223]OCX54840.1 NUDIX hydrolase [Mucilaginibacter sp. PPCGB 2223]